MTEQASPYNVLTDEQVDQIVDMVDAAVDRDLKAAVAAGMGPAGALVGEWVARGSVRAINLAKPMGVPPVDLYKAMVEQGLVAVGLDIISTFSEPTPSAYAKMAEAICQDFVASFTKGVSELIRSHVKLN